MKKLLLCFAIFSLAMFNVSCDSQQDEMDQLMLFDIKANNDEQGNTINITITQTPPPRGSKGNNVTIEINQTPEA